MGIQNDGTWEEVPTNEGFGFEDSHDEGFSPESIDELDEPAGEVITVDSSTNAVDVFSPATGVDLDVAPPLTYEEAKSLTEHIRATTDVLYVLIQRAHAGKAWLPLGYSSFGDYVKEEFSISRSRAYQLLNQATLIEQIAAVAPEGTRFNISEAAARDLKTLVEEIVPDIADATRGLDPEDAGDLIEEMIREQRERKNQEAALPEGGESYDEELAADQADRDGFSSNGNGEWSGNGGPGNGNGPVSVSQEGDDSEGALDDDDLENLFSFDDDPRETRMRLESLYNLYNALSALKSMPDFDKIIDWIPAERRVQVSQSLPNAVQWLQSFQEYWNRQPWASTEESFGEPKEGDESKTHDFASGDEEDIFAGLSSDSASNADDPNSW